MSDYTTHPEWLALLAAIRASTADDLRRLVAADWLEERGQEDRALLIRSMVESPTQTFWIGYDHLGRSTRGPNATGLRDDETRMHTVRRGFTEHVRCQLVSWIGGPCQGCEGRRVLHFGPSPPDYPARSEPCSGCDGAGEWPAFGPGICRRNPVLHVELTDRSPSHDVEVDSAGNTIETWIWYRTDAEQHGGRPDHLPVEVFDLLPGGEQDAPGGGWKAYPTLEQALGALSTALIAWALAQPAQTV